MVTRRSRRTSAAGLRIGRGAAQRNGRAGKLLNLVVRLNKRWTSTCSSYSTQMDTPFSLSARLEAAAETESAHRRSTGPSGRETQERSPPVDTRGRAGDDRSRRATPGFPREGLPLEVARVLLWPPRNARLQRQSLPSSPSVGPRAKGQSAEPSNSGWRGHHGGQVLE
jgi:hypothetical protein